MDVYQPVSIGSDFLGYRIEELIGRGGMGVVYRAYDLRLKRPVAVKLVTPSLARDERFRERFARESELVMSLEHPNVVPIYDAGDVDGRVYLAMRLVDGTDLGALLRTEGALEPDRAMAICTQIAAALDAAHARGLVHRDVKPSNVLLDSSGHVYLADFGLTRGLDEEGGVELGDDRLAGTPAYIAPEQLEGRTADGRSDVYSLGCVLYECLTGEPVFVRGSRLAVAWAHLEDEPPRPSKRRAGLLEAVDAVVGRALAKEPEQRYPTCGALVAAAAHALGLGRVGPSRRRAVLLAGAIGLAIAVAGVVIATTVVQGAPRSAAAPLLAGPNTLARIDPTTNNGKGSVSAVLSVGADPVVAAGADYTVWVYSRGARTITQINGETNRRVETTHVSLPAECCSLFTGPVLAADPSGVTGAWFVEGGFAGRRALLVHIPVDRLGEQEYPLPLTPTGVAAGGDAVWVVGHDARGYEVLRINPASGLVTKTLRFPARVDSIAYGYREVWVMSSATATLYKINPQSVRQIRKLVVAADSRALRPEIMSPRGNEIWIRVTPGTLYSINPSRLQVNSGFTQPYPYPQVYSRPAPSQEEDLGNLGALWWYDWPTGTLNRQEVANGSIRQIHVTRLRPAAGGPCLTSMTVASGSIWLTVAPSNHSVCTR